MKFEFEPKTQHSTLFMLEQRVDADNATGCRSKRGIHVLTLSNSTIGIKQRFSIAYAVDDPASAALCPTAPKSPKTSKHCVAEEIVKFPLGQAYWHAQKKEIRKAFCWQPDNLHTDFNLQLGITVEVLSTTFEFEDYNETEAEMLMSVRCTRKDADD